MPHQIYEITIKNIKYNEFNTLRLYRPCLLANDGTISFAIKNSKGMEIAMFSVRICGNTCECFSSNENFVIEKIPGLTIINKVDHKPENINKWISLLQ